MKSEINNSNEPARSTLASFLLFTGPIVAAGGILAIFRTQERDPFYALLIPVGIIMWFAGVILRFRPHPPSK